MRSIQSITLGTSLVAGTVHLVAYRVLAEVPVPIANVNGEPWLRDESKREWALSLGADQAFEPGRGRLAAKFPNGVVGQRAALPEDLPRAEDFDSGDTEILAAAMGVEPMVSASPQALATFITREFSRWEPVVKTASIQSLVACPRSG